MDMRNWLPGRKKVEDPAPKEKVVVQDPASLEPRNSEEAFEMLKLFHAKLRNNSLVTVQEDDREKSYSESREGQMYQRKIEEIENKYGSDPAIAEYIARKIEKQNAENELWKKKRIAEINAELQKLESQSNSLKKELESLSSPT